MIKVIERYKKGIFIYVVLNIFALFVNVYNMDFHSIFYSQKPGDAIEIDGSYSILSSVENPKKREQTGTYIYFFTMRDYNDKENFWPIVPFYSGKKIVSRYDNNYIEYAQTFRGPFFDYDKTEFFFYMGLLIIFLVYKSYIKPSQIKPPVSISET